MTKHVSRFALTLPPRKLDLSTRLGLHISVFQGAAYYRLELAFEEFPYRLLALVGGDEEQAQQAAQDVYTKPTCCLDELCTERLRNLFPDAASLAKSPAVLEALGAWTDKAAREQGQRYRRSPQDESYIFASC